MVFIVGFFLPVRTPTFICFLPLFLGDDFYSAIRNDTSIELTELEFLIDFEAILSELDQLMAEEMLSCVGGLADK